MHHLGRPQQHLIPGSPGLSRCVGPHESTLTAIGAAHGPIHRSGRLYRVTAGASRRCPGASRPSAPW
ncbi:hypothetical protein ACFFX0_16910 [Citricoccus parietis]|uniref:Uncharacterized protein n=1 Tax=Citricoccus parietis TaxID=592307 RepID=A0ABV5G1G9_9MICC